MLAKEISVKRYVVRLSGEERERLETLLRKGKSPALQNGPLTWKRASTAGGCWPVSDRSGRFWNGQWPVLLTPIVWEFQEQHWRPGRLPDQVEGRVS
jgi:hypothetical protein